MSTGAGLEDLFNQVKGLLPRLRDLRRSWMHEKLALEPYVVSETYGLQGRADIVLCRPGEFDIIEMKAGKAPSASIRLDHRAQVAAYHMLIQEQHPQALVRSLLWYVQDEHNPLKDVGSPETAFASLIAARNAIVASDLAIASRDVRPLRTLTTFDPQRGAGASSYELGDLEAMSFALRNLDATEKHAVAAWLGLVSGELLEQRIGTSRTRTVLTNLEYDAEESDTAHMHLVFHRRGLMADTPIRTGDAVVLRLFQPNGTPQLLSTRFKASVREITASNVVLSLRNKFAPVQEFPPGTWDIELDTMDSASKAHYAGIRAFLELSPDKRAVLLGRRTPQMGAQRACMAPNLTDSQRAIIERALSARELFLIQGPPGTGKTSAVLRALVQELTHDPDERVLVLAYTNRAANEICEVLTRYDIPFARHGSLEGATGSHSIPHMARTYSPEALSEHLRATKCVVSTLQSLTSSPEIWEFGSFTTAVVDEASQILEPMLLLPMARTNRTILIGDHCQLPAVVVQPLDRLATHHPLLGEIHLTSTSISAFERLLRCATTDVHVALLHQQGRMHSDVMTFPAQAFYAGALTCLNDHQTDTNPLPWSHILPHRACYVDLTDAEAQVRYAVDLASTLARLPHQLGNHTSVGIISPFRIINNAILQALPFDVRQHCTVDTVERFQGSERDVIIYIAAVSTLQEFDQIRSEIDYNGARIDRKLNVAMTRAKEQFVMIGDAQILSTSSVYAKAIASLHRHRP
jgi:DNA replication ATP-dependent helicase Dna2